MSLLRLCETGAPTATTVGEVMTQDAWMVGPDATIAQAAVLMQEQDVGSVLVGEGDRLVGVLTDRDVALRAIARNLGPETPVRKVMTDGVKYCCDRDAVRSVAHNMALLRVRRLPVVNHDKRLVGFISLGNIARSGDPGDATILLNGIATPH